MMASLIGALVGLFTVAVLLFLSKRFMRKANPADSSSLILEEPEGELLSDWNPVCEPYKDRWAQALREEGLRIEAAVAMDKKKRA